MIVDRCRRRLVRVLPLTVLSISVSVPPSLPMPPPSPLGALLPLTVQFVSVRAPKMLRMPALVPALLPPVIVRPMRFTSPLLYHDHPHPVCRIAADAATGAPSVQDDYVPRAVHRHGRPSKNVFAVRVIVVGVLAGKAVSAKVIVCLPGVAPAIASRRRQVFAFPVAQWVIFRDRRPPRYSRPSVTAMLVR